MDLDVDVARLKLMKANHQSQQYRLEDNLLRYFPEQIEQSKGFIAGFEADMKTLAEHPHPALGFAGMTVRGDVLTDKENAGAALVDAFKDVKGLDPVPIGSYRGFQMSLTLEDFGRDYVLTLKGQMTHRVTLGKDPRGNLTRIDNALNGMADRLATVQSKLESLYSQMETAKQELGKPFPQEDELRVKSARLAELNIALNIDDSGNIFSLIQSSFNVVFHTLIIALVDFGIHCNEVANTAITIHITTNDVSTLVIRSAVFAASLSLSFIITRVLRATYRLGFTSDNSSVFIRCINIAVQLVSCIRLALPVNTVDVAVIVGLVSYFI